VLHLADLGQVVVCELDGPVFVHGRDLVHDGGDEQQVDALELGALDDHEEQHVAVHVHAVVGEVLLVGPVEVGLEFTAHGRERGLRHDHVVEQDLHEAVVHDDHC